VAQDLGLVRFKSPPRYLITTIGEQSVDGLGYTWQSNVFGHYALFRVLEPALRRSSSTPCGTARLVWMSSLMAEPANYDPEDWQLVRTYDSYALSKYQIDLIATQLDKRATQAAARASPDEPNAVEPRHFLFQPGVVGTNNDRLIGPIRTMIRNLVFVLVRPYLHCRCGHMLTGD
jgi:3-keto steroid reductase